MTNDTYAHVKDFIGQIGATIHHGGNKACFIPLLDCIRLPELHDFESIEHYYATSPHEHGHWSGHTTRLNRDLSTRFGDESYAAEELVAEMTAAFLYAHLEIPGKLRHTEYIASWLRVLQKDKKAIFTAARKATEAPEFLRSFSREEESHE